MRLSLALVLVCLGGPAWALGENVGQNTSQFLKLGAGARALGMGEAYGPVAEGAEAIYWNPAGLAKAPAKEFHYSRTEFMRFFHHDFAAYVHPLGHGALAGSFTRFSQDDLPVVTNGNITIGQFAPHSEAISFAYARRFAEDDPHVRDRDYFKDSWAVPGAYRPLSHEREPFEGEFSVGLGLKIVNETIYTHSASAFAVDGGVIYQPVDMEGLGLSAAFRNLGSKQRFIADAEELPGELDLGLAYSSRWEGSRLLPVIEASLPLHGLPSGRIGLEYTRPAGEDVTVAFRGGYKSLTAADLSPLSGLTGGIGVAYRRFSFDFAFQPLAELGQAYRLSLAFRW